MRRGGIAFIVNARAGKGLAGDGCALQRETLAAQADGGEVSLIEDGAQIAAAVRRAKAADCKVVVACGGDGTLNSVASKLVDSGITLGVLPLGTLNHFAKDLGIPLERDAALANLRNGTAAAVDVGEVNGHFFLNNSGLGLYPSIVRDRELQQSRLGRAKWPAFFRATLAVLRRYPFLDVRLSLNGREQVYRTPFVFIGNNEYVMDGLRIGARAALDRGVLSVYVAQRTGRWGLLRLAFRALFGHLREARDFRAMLAPEVHIETRHRRIRVSTDGEVCMLDTPLHYRIHPGALRVIAPHREKT